MARRHKRQKSLLERDLPSLQMQKMCLGKSIFWSEHAANWKVLTIRKGGGPQLRSYQCPNCHQWHLSSQQRAETRPSV